MATGIGLYRTFLASRGLGPGAVARLDDARHPVLDGMDGVMDTLKAVHDRGERIVVIPDYDMDGISAGVLGWAGLSELGFDTAIQTPDYRRGHEVSAADVDDALALGARALITCDGGINSREGARRAMAAHVPYIITDHHTELESMSAVSLTTAAVDPCRIGSTYPHTGICGAHVFWQVLCEYARRYDPDASAAIDRLVVFAGLGTVSDVMPMLYENRAVTRSSVAIMRRLWPGEASIVSDVDPRSMEYVWAMDGLTATLACMRHDGRVQTPDDIDEDAYGWTIAPAFNAARRVNGDMHDCFGVFTDPDNATLHAQNVFAMNERRKAMTADIWAAMHECDQPGAPWVWLSDAPSGMLGLLAAKAMREGGDHPVAVVNPVTHAGSMRAPAWYPVISTLTPLGFTCVGHEGACGIRPCDTDRLAEALETTATAMRPNGNATPKADITIGETGAVDASFDDGQALLDFLDIMESLAPFGPGFPRPTAAVRVDPECCTMRAMGRNGEHACITTPQDFRIVAWNATERMSRLMRSGGPFTLVCNLERNTWNGTTCVEAVVDE